MNMTPELCEKLTDMILDLANEAAADIGPLAETDVEMFEPGNSRYPGAKITAELVGIKQDELVTKMTCQVHFNSDGVVKDVITCEEIALHNHSYAVRAIGPILEAFDRMSVSVKAIDTALKMTA